MTRSTMSYRRAVFANRTFAYAFWLGAALLTLTNSAYASECEMRLSNTEVNYGALSRGAMDIRRNAPINLGSRQLSLTVVCPQETPIGLSFEGQAADSGSYRFAEKGRFTVKLNNAQLDGKPIQFARRGQSNGALVGIADELQLLPNERAITVAQGQATAGKVFSAQIEIQAYVDEESTRVRDTKVYKGHGTLVLDAR